VSAAGRLISDRYPDAGGSGWRGLRCSSVFEMDDLKVSATVLASIAAPLPGMVTARSEIRSGSAGRNSRRDVGVEVSLL
jgi:hypothetical protein